MANKNAIQKSSAHHIDARNRTQSGSQPIETRSGQQAPSTAWTYRPNVDIFDTADEVLVVADLPGATQETIDVATEAGVLTIHAQIAPRYELETRVILQEYGVGSFHRRFEVDNTIDTQNISADYRHGVLTVHLPKAQQARRRRIQVTG